MGCENSTITFAWIKDHAWFMVHWIMFMYVTNFNSMQQIGDHSPYWGVGIILWRKSWILFIVPRIVHHRVQWLKYLDQLYIHVSILNALCRFRKKHPYPSQRELLENSSWGRRRQKPNFLKKRMKQNWYFLRDWKSTEFKQKSNLWEENGHFQQQANSKAYTGTFETSNSKLEWYGQGCFISDVSHCTAWSPAVQFWPCDH